MKPDYQELTYYTLDVFTDTPFGGNPLAVFTDVGDLSDQQMQQIAAELNLSETVFIREHSGSQRWAIRIFMPKREIPFAGHPTVGTALLIKALGWLGEGAGSSSLVLDEVAGAVPVVFSAHPKGHALARFSTPVLPSIISSELSLLDVAGLLQLAPEQIKCVPYIADCGAPFQFVELTDIEAVIQATPDLSLWQTLLGQGHVQDVCIYSFSQHTSDIRMRMFAPLAGIAEDPATGSAAAALVGSLALRNQQSVNQGWVIEQGAEMGRPSLLGTFVKANNTGVVAVEVFGSAVLISKGVFYLYYA